MPQGRELKVRPRRGSDDTGTVEEMGVALRRGHHRGRFAIGFAKEAVRGPCDQATCSIGVLHQLQEGAELARPLAPGDTLGEPVDVLGDLQPADQGREGRAELHEAGAHAPGAHLQPAGTGLALGIEVAGALGDGDRVHLFGRHARLGERGGDGAAGIAHGQLHAVEPLLADGGRDLAVLHDGGARIDHVADA